MDEPADAAAVAAHLRATQGLGSIDVPSACRSNRLDNARAKGFEKFKVVRESGGRIRVIEELPLIRARNAHPKPAREG